MKTFQLTSVFIGLLLTVGQTSAQENSDAEVEKHKIGRYEIPCEGALGSVYLRAANDYGINVDSGLAASINSGSTKWVKPQNGELSYRVEVPETYRPDAPHGVIVFISANANGNSPFRNLLSEHKLISIAANNSGNQTDTIHRHSYAVQAVGLLAERYELDPDRIYISGCSGGGRVCSQVMIMNSDLFTGGAPYVGANPCIAMRNTSSNGNAYSDPGSWPKPNRQLLARAANMGRYAFMTGEKDYNRANVKSVAEGYQKAGFANITYIEEPGLGHTRPSDEYFDKAFRFMDAPLNRAAATHFASAQKADDAGKLGQALPLYLKAAMHGKDADWVTTAAQRYSDLNQQYKAAQENAQNAIQTTDKAAFKKAFSALGKTWSVPSAELKAMKKKFAAAVKEAKSKR